MARPQLPTNGMPEWGNLLRESIWEISDRVDIKADLVGGVVPNNQIPSLAISDFLGSVASESAMLALVGQKGDWTVRTDTSTTWIISGPDGSTLANWTQISTPASGVQSVNGKSGSSITLSKSDIGLGNVDNTSDLLKPISNATNLALSNKQAAGDYPTTTTMNTELAKKAPLASPAFTGTPTGITKTHVGLGNVDNTSDSAKPVSSATQTALNGKSDLSHTHPITGVTGLSAALDGKAGLWPIIMPASNNLDDITTPGTYIQNTDAGAGGAALNYPFARAGVLEVMAGGDPTNKFLFQRYSEYANSARKGRVWTRNKFSTWSPWVQIADNADVDTLNMVSVARANLHGGGDLISLSAAVAWTYRFICMGIGRNAMCPSGYWVVDVPPNGTVIPVYNSSTYTSVTVENGRVPMPSTWMSLYYEIPIGGGATSKPENFRIVHYNSGDFTVPSTWVLICSKSGDTNFSRSYGYKWGTGVYTHWDPPSGLIKNMTWPAVVAHRGGANIYPEASLEGYEACAAAGYTLEIDVRPLSDGTLVLCHDATVNRTMTNITAGNVNARTPSQWKKGRVNPAIQGGDTGTPAFFSEILDKYGGKVPMVIEIKDLTTTTAEAVCKAVMDRGLTKDVVVQCFTYSLCLISANYGIPTCYLSTSTPAETPATIKAAGIDYVGMGKAIVTSTVTSMKAAGLKTLAWTIEDDVEAAAAFTKGFDGIITDDPWYADGNIVVSSKDPYDQGIRPPGLEHSRLASPVPGTSPIFLSGRAIALGGTDDGTIRNITCPWAGSDLSIPVRIQMDLTLGSSSSDQNGNLGFWLGSIPAEDRFPTDGAKAGQNVFGVIVRKSGILNAYQLVNGASPAVSLSATATAPYARVWTESTVQLIAKFTPTLVRITVNAGQQSLYGDFVPSMSPTGMRLWLRTSGTSGEFSDIRISNPYLA